MQPIECVWDAHRVPFDHPEPCAGCGLEFPAELLLETEEFEPVCQKCARRWVCPDCGLAVIRVLEDVDRYCRRCGFGEGDDNA